MSIGQTDIADIKIDVTSHDDLLLILLGLQRRDYGTRFFKLLEEIAPTKLEANDVKTVALDNGKP